MNKANLTRIFVLFWALYLFLIALYQRGTTDEGAYFYQAYFMSLGHIPVIDFFSTHLPWFYLPFAAIIWLVGNEIDSVRIFAYLVVLGGIGLITRVVLREAGIRAAVVTFLIVTFSWVWMDSNLEVRHSTICNFAILAALYFMSRPKPLRPIDAFAIGAFVSIAVNARAVLLIWGAIVYVYFLIDLKKNQREDFWRLAVFASGAAILLAAPTLVLLAWDPEGFLYNFIQARLQSSLENSSAEFTLAQRLLEIVIAYGYQFLLGMKTNLIIPIAAVIILLFMSSFDRRNVIDKLIHSNTVKIITVFIIGILLSYSVSDKIHPLYFHHNIPLFAALLGISYGVVSKNISGRRAGNYLQWTIGTLLGIYCAGFVAISFPEIWLRNDPFIKRPMEVVRIGCWLEKHTDPGEVVFSAMGTPAVAAARLNARGLEQGVGILGFFWSGSPNRVSISAEDAERYKLLTTSEALRQLETQKYSVVVTDFLLDIYMNQEDQNQLAEILAKRYREVTWPGRRGNYSLFLSNAHDLRDYPRYVIKPFYRTNKYEGKLSRMISQGDIVAALDLAVDDISESLYSLPEDLGGTFARVTGGNFAARCGSSVEKLS